MVTKELAELVLEWANERGIVEKSNPHAQLSKAVEELGEVAEAINKNGGEDVDLEIGDVVVTMILLAAQYGHSLDHCLGKAYEKISSRKGKVVDGVFVKEEDAA